jgi:NADPH:quinone reductase-like Zn-dependent oxidoreductase
VRVSRVADPRQRSPLMQEEVPQPQPGSGELLIRVCAAGVIPTELSWYPTSYRKSGEARTGAVPCHEFSGVVAALGDGVESVKIGDEVFGMNDWYSEGALAEYCLAPSLATAPKPHRLTHVEAASVPISALTAWQGLFDHAKLQPDERVLVHGGAGGIGIFAIQLARIRGAHVIATASSQNRDFVLGLGAETVVDYHKSRFEDSAKQMDVVFDTVGGETLEPSWGVLKPDGRMVTVVSTVANFTDPKVQRAFFIVEPNQKQLVEVAALVDRRHLWTVVDGIVAFSQAPAAYTGGVQRQGRGKLVVEVANTE